MKKILFTGPISTRSGYGSRSRDFCRALIELGYELTIIPTRWGNTPLDVLTSDKDMDLLTRVATSPDSIEQPDIFIQCTIPNEFKRIEGAYNIGLTAGIETDAPAPEWVEGCNRMDMVIVSSEHSKNVFERVSFKKKNAKTDEVVADVKIEVPISVILEGVDVDGVYNDDVVLETEYLTEYLDGIPEDFLFLFVGHWMNGDLGEDRKNVAGLIMTFLETFKTKDDKKELPGLLLKTTIAGYSPPEKHILLNKMQDVYKVVQERNGKGYRYPNMYLLFGDLTDYDMNYLYQHRKVKVMTSFTHGEGFGRPLLEFTTTGKPVIAPKWSGQLDFLHEKYNKFLGGHLQPVHPSVVNKWFIRDSKWFKVSMDSGRILRDCYDNYNKFLKLSKKQLKYTLENFTFDHMKDQIGEVLENLPKSNKPQQKKIQLPKLKAKDEN